MSDVAAAYTQLLTRSPDVPEHVIAGILACGSDAVAPLVALLTDRSLDAADHPNQGTARPHAAELIGHIGDVQGVPPLLDVLVADRHNQHLVSACADALARLGDVVGPALTKLSTTTHLHERMMLAMVLASGGERHDAIRDLLRELLPQDPDVVLPLVSSYGDPALAPDVAQTLLGAKGVDTRVIKAVFALRKLGIVHPKLDDLAQKADEKIRYEVSQELLDEIAPDLELLKSYQAS